MFISRVKSVHNYPPFNNNYIEDKISVIREIDIATRCKTRLFKQAIQYEAIEAERWTSIRDNSPISRLEINLLAVSFDGFWLNRDAYTYIFFL